VVPQGINGDRRQVRTQIASQVMVVPAQSENCRRDSARFYKLLVAFSTSNFSTDRLFQVLTICQPSKPSMCGCHEQWLPQRHCYNIRSCPYFPLQYNTNTDWTKDPAQSLVLQSVADAVNHVMPTFATYVLLSDIPHQQLACQDTLSLELASESS
jgi:hypothetical protein